MTLKPVSQASAQPFPAITQSTVEPLPQFKIELDDRAILLPDGKIAQHVLLILEPHGKIAFDAIFMFNQTHRPSRLLTLSVAEAGEFAAELVNAVYAAKGSFVFGKGLKIAINVVANGYKLEVQHEGDAFDFFLSTGVIWRFIRGMLMAIDASSPNLAN